MEQVLDWLNENELRSYPLLDGIDKAVTLNDASWIFPDDFILDMQLLALNLPTQANSSPLTQLKFYISKITKEMDTVLVEVSYSGKDNTHQPSTTVSATLSSFSISSASSTNYPLYIRNPDGCLAVFGAGVLKFLNACGNIDTEISTDLQLEHSIAVQFSGPWLGVSSLAVTPEKSTESGTYAPKLPLESTQIQTELSGDIALLAGYNFRVAIENTLIDLQIGTDHGLRASCSTSFIPEEYLDCSQLVSYINGVPPDSKGAFKLNAGSNISIYTGNTLPDFYDPLSEEEQTETSNTHTLFVGLSFQSSDICAPVNITPSLI